jgi:hypothetical protein
MIIVQQWDNFFTFAVKELDAAGRLNPSWNRKIHSPNASETGSNTYEKA